MRYMGGEQLYVPMSLVDTSARNRMIAARYAAGEPVWALGIAHDITEGRVYQILRAARERGVEAP